MEQPAEETLHPRTLRLLAFAWIGVVLFVGVCTFLGILWAIGGQSSSASAAAALPIDPASAAESQPADEPGAAPPNTPVEGTELSTNPPTESSAASPATTSPPTPIASPAPTLDRSFAYGVQSRLEVATDRTVESLIDLGVPWVKIEVRWDEIEATQGEPDWSTLDSILEATSQNDIRVLATVVGAPDWARTTITEGRIGPPDDPTAFADFVGQLVTRYGGQINAIELWEEQNLIEQWDSGTDLSAQSYVSFLAPAAQAVREADNTVVIVSGAPAPTGLNDAAVAIDDFLYMQGMLDAGLLSVVDCVGVSANGNNLPPTQTAEDAFSQGIPPGTIFIGPFDVDNPLNPHHSWSFYSTINGHHDIIVSSGEDTPLCVTSFGWATIVGMEGDVPAGAEFALDNTLETQSEYVLGALEQLRDWDFVWMAFLYNLDYSPKANGDPQAEGTLFSILDPEGNPRPAYEALQSFSVPTP
ncbi:MAG: hypothetical protein GYB68_00650 [Chloroflexi bacterium]|nr:hypothetical protein [Chloroflexota bacterium]